MTSDDNNLENLEQSILDLRKVCWQKRMVLIELAAKRQKWERNLHFASGVISLFSGASVAALLLLIAGKDYLKIIGSVVGGLSGVLSLIVTTYFGAKDTQKIFEGAAKYGTLRDELFILVTQIGQLSKSTIQSKFEKIYKEYGELAPRIDSYLPPNMTERFAALERLWPEASRLGPADGDIGT